MRPIDFTRSASAAAMVAAFGRYGARIAFAPEAGAGSGAAAKPLAARKDGAKKDDAPGDAPAASQGDKLDRLLTMLDSFGTRLDKLEAGKEEKGAAAQPEDEPRSEEEQTARAIQDGMAEVKARMPQSVRDRMDAQRKTDDALAKIQWRADSAFNLHGKRAPAPMAGETPIAYRIRTLREHQRFSPAFQNVDLGAIARADAAGFDAIEAKVYADSAEASKRPEGPEDGGLLMRTRINPDSGAPVREFFGKSTFLKEMAPPVTKYLSRIRELSELRSSFGA